METCIKIFPKYCSCQNRLGLIQYDYECFVEEKVNKGINLFEAQKMGCKHFGIQMMCCRNNVLNTSLYFVNNANALAIQDHTGFIEGPTHPYHVNSVNYPGIIVQSKIEDLR